MSTLDSCFLPGREILLPDARRVSGERNPECLRVGRGRGSYSQGQRVLQGWGESARMACLEQRMRTIEKQTNNMLMGFFSH